MYLTIAHLDFISPTSKSKILRKWDTLGGGGVAEKNRNLKAAKIFCKTPLHREMNKKYKELFSDFSMNK